MRPPPLLGLCAVLIFVGPYAGAQAAGGRAAAKAALDAACEAGDCSNAKGVFDAASRADDEFQACGPSCAKPALARMKIALSYSMSTWTAAVVGGVDPQPVIDYALGLDAAFDARGPFDAADLARAESDWLCAEKRPACARIRRANEGLALLAEGLARCGAGGCPPDALAAVCRSFQEAHHYSALDDADQMAGTYAHARLKELSAPVDELVAKKLGPGLDASEAELGDVDRALEGAASGRADLESPDALSGRLESAQAQWRQASQAVNFCAAPTASVERMNTVARGLRSARARLGALRVARGLAAEPGREAAGAVLAQSAAHPSGANGALASRPGRGRKDVLALSSALLPSAKVDQPASILLRDEGVPAPSQEDATELERIQSLREKGAVRLVGDPVGRAALVHAQTGQNCVIVSQQQILVMAGLLDNSNPAATEDALRREADANGYHDQEWGTLPEHRGSLLMDRGFLVTRTDSTSPERLETAVNGGRPVIVDVDARRLWGEPGRAVIRHAIVITGALSDPSTGKLLGYFVNDSGIKPPSRARFIPAQTFLGMWRAAGADMLEVL